MILTCPACSTRYLTDPAALGQTGRTVRCAKCGHDWHQMPPADAGPRADVQSPSLETRPYTPAPGAGLPARIEPTSARRGGGGLALALVLVLVAAGALYLGRERVVAAWPDAAQLYAVVGVPVDAFAAGLAFADVTLTREAFNGRDTVVVEGRILNNSSLTRPVPPLLAVLRDAEDRTLKTWTVRIEPTALEAGSATDFRTSLVDPPRGADRIAVTFAREAGS